MFYLYDPDELYCSQCHRRTCNHDAQRVTGYVLNVAQAQPTAEIRQADPLAATWGQEPLFDDTPALPLFSGTPIPGHIEHFNPPEVSNEKQLPLL